MQIANALITYFLRRRLSRVLWWKEHPLEAQQQVFRQLIASGINTVWGKVHKYASIRSVADFQNRCPLQDYDTLKPWIERVMKGENSVLWPSPIRWFAKSSGTTSDRSKFIPVSREALQQCHYKGGLDFLTLYCAAHPHTQLYRGKGLIVGGSSKVNHLNKNSRYGDLSAVLLSNLSPLAQFFRTPRLRIALLPEWEKKIEWMARETMRENVTHIAGVPSWTLVLLKKILELSGKSTLTKVWPHLELYLHGGVSFTPYAPQFKMIIPSEKTRYRETYNASEGFFAFQDTEAHEGMLLLVHHGIFYEFIPVSEVGKDHPRTLTLEAVQLNENYAVVISTNAGLWRYQLGDTVKFTSLNPYRITVTGRTRHYINAFGEELMIENAEKALAIACRETDSLVNEYTAAPIYFSSTEKPRHEWLIEFEQEPQDIDTFARSLDKALQALNSDYEAKRYKDITLQLPLVRKVKKGVFHAWLKSKGKLGGQHKVPRLCNDRKFVDEILQFMQLQP